MARFLIDTNHLGVLVGPHPALRARVVARFQGGDQFGTIMPVICELQCGLIDTDNPVVAARRLRTSLRQVRIWPLEMPDTARYGALYRDLRSRGRVLSQVDIMIAAIALRLRATLLTTDRDFEALPEVPTENWLG